MDDTLLLTVTLVGQVGDDVLIAPSLPANIYYLSGVEKVKIVTPDNHIIERDADFSIPLGANSYIYLLLIHNTQKEEIPLGSQIWIQKPLEQITRKPDTTEE
ncbi:MAG: hypothetical protein AB1607_00240 [Chloroflexota bacterium]